MISHYTKDEFDNCKSNECLKLECYECHKKFPCKKAYIKEALYSDSPFTKCKYCSVKCCGAAKAKSLTLFTCDQCGKTIMKLPSQVSPHNFCSRSCSVTYNNAHKIKGNRRSKLEIWIEEQLYNKFPNLKFQFNRKDAIDSELDIYIPSLKLAFELNGIFHYEPIYGSEKLNQIKNNDNRKFQACIEKQISLCIIDCSTFKHFKASSAIKYLNIIENIILSAI